MNLVIESICLDYQVSSFRLICTFVIYPSQSLMLENTRKLPPGDHKNTSLETVQVLKLYIYEKEENVFYTKNIHCKIFLKD